MERKNILQGVKQIEKFWGGFLFLMMDGSLMGLGYHVILEPRPITILDYLEEDNSVFCFNSPSENNAVSDIRQDATKRVQEALQRANEMERSFKENEKEIQSPKDENNRKSNCRMM